jgi:hypothetical protein
MLHIILCFVNGASIATRQAIDEPEPNVCWLIKQKKEVRAVIHSHSFNIYLAKEFTTAGCQLLGVG